MTHFRNILAVYNGKTGSEAVLEQAVALAHAQEARLTLLKHVGADEPVAEAQKRLRRIVPWIVQQGVVKVETVVTTGQPDQEILRQAAQQAHDLLIVGAADGAGRKTVIFGDLATSLMRHCPCPVWILRPEHPVPCTRILAAIGDGDGDADTRAINRGIVGLGTALALAQDAELHILHAWSPKGADAELLTNEIAEETREAIIRRNEAARRSAVNNLLSGFPVTGLNHQIHLPRGLPQQTIVGLARRLGVDVVVMGKAWRTGLHRMFVGNPAETVFGTVGCSLLCVTADNIGAAGTHKHTQEVPPARLRAVAAR